MRVLAIETSASPGSVALLDDDRVVAERDFAPGSRHGRDLLPCVDAVTGGDPRAAALLAFSAGPGSYTGLRVGLTFVKTFGADTGVPVVGVSTLDVIAANVGERGWLCVVTDARLSQVYAALYDADRNKVLGDLAAAPADVAAAINPETLVVGDALRRHRTLFSERGRVSDDESLWRPRAANVARLGRVKFLQLGPEDPLVLVPRYLRRAQAEVKWDQVQAASGRK